MLYFPTVAFLDEWFIKRKGFAFGVMWAGAGREIPSSHHLGRTDIKGSQWYMHTIRHGLGP